MGLKECVGLELDGFLNCCHHFSRDAERVTIVLEA